MSTSLALLSGPLPMADLQATLNQLILNVNAADSTSLALLSGPPDPSAIQATLYNLILRLNAGGSSIAEIVGPLDPANLELTLNSLILEFNASGGSPEMPGIVLIDGGTISSPVEYLDITLPAGYGSFIIQFNNAAMDTADIFCGAFSSDAGVSFINDRINDDTYAFAGYVSQPGSLNNRQTTSGLMAFANSGQVAPIVPYSGEIKIFQGDATYPAKAFSNFVFERRIAGASSYISCAQAIVINRDAVTPPPAPAAINLIRLLPYGNGDCNPPTSGENLTAGSWALLGVPT